MTPKWLDRGYVRVAVGVGGVFVVAFIVALAFLRLQGRGGGPDLPDPLGSPPQSQSKPTEPPTMEGLLSQRAGFGGKVRGGRDGVVARVTTDADSGPGSLREAVTGDQPVWIVFDRDMRIDLSTPLRVGSNKTIDGRARKVVISAPGQPGLELIGVSNVIIESLTLTDFGDVAKTAQNDLPDAIHLEGATGVWIDHNDLSKAGDKLIAISGGSQEVTVSWNHLHDQEQVIQIGNQANQDLDAAQTVTLHHNFFDRTGYRNPVVSYGKAHVYNNYYLDWRLYAVRTERVAQLYLENNIFESGRNRRVVLVVPQGDGCNDKGTRCDSRAGFLRAEGNLAIGTRAIRDSNPERVFDPSANYAYSAEPADRGLAERVAAGTGPPDCPLQLESPSAC